MISASPRQQDGTPCRRRRTVRAALAAVAVVLASLVLPLRTASADVTFNQRMLELVNRDRAANGLWPLVADSVLGANAEDAPYNGCGFPVAGRAKDMGQRNYFSHTILGCGSQSVFNILNSVSGLIFSGAGENIAWMNGTTDPLVAAENLHNQLMNSPGHRANVLSTNFTRIGIGSWRTAPGQTWSGGGFALPNVYIGVQIFAGGAVSSTTTTTPPTTPPSFPGAEYHPLTPARILDTRTGLGAPLAPVGSGETLNMFVTGRGGVPTAGVTAVVFNVAVTQPTAPSYLTVFPTGEAMPMASNLNFWTGQTVPNLVTAKVGAHGQVSLFNAAGSTHLVVDVAGWYDDGTLSSGGRYHPLSPSRILDTRTGNGSAAAPLGPGSTIDLQVTGRGGVPSTGVGAVVLNVAVTQPTAMSHLTVFPAGQAMPSASNLNYVAGQTVPNLVLAKVGASGRVSIYNVAGSTHVVADVAGWYDSGSASNGSRFHPLTPSRVLNTIDGTGAPAGPAGPGATVNLQVTGRGGVPSTGVAAVVLNVAVTGPTSMSHLTVYPSGEAMPVASNLNFVPGQTVANLVTAKVGANGMVSIYNVAGSTHVVADVAGWYAAG